MAKDKSTVQSSRPEEDDDADNDDADNTGGQGDNASTGDGKDGDAGGDDDGKGGQDDQDGGDGKDEPRFTQAQVDAMIERRLRRERRKGKQGNSTKADDDDGKGGKGGDAQGTQSDDDAEARVVARLRKAEARQVARDLKVRPDRIKSVIRLAELDGIDPDDTDDIEDAIAEVLEDHPEWKAQPSKDVRPKARASGRDDSGDTKQGRTWTRAEIAALSDDDYEKNRDSINEAMKKGLIKS